MLKFYSTLVLLFLLIACNSESEKDVISSACKENKPCNYSGDYSIWLDNESISPETEFIVKFKAPEQINIKQAKLEGVNMYMGSIPLMFEYKDGVWQSKAMLGACAEPIMQWRLRLDFIDKSQLENQNINTTSLLYFFTSKY